MRKESLTSRLWNSATLLTWGSLASKLANLTVLLPWVLRKFTVEETALWLLLSVFIGLQIVIDIGFSQTFSRIIAYTRGGAVSPAQSPPSIGGGIVHDSKNSLAIISAMRVIYARLAAIAFLLLLVFGTLAVSKSIVATGDKFSGWVAWSFVVVSSTYSLYGNQYTAYLIGVDKIAVLRRWEIATTLAAICCSIIVLLLEGGLLSLIVVTQTWQIISIVRNKFLVKALDSKERSWTSLPKNFKVPKDIWLLVWPSAWRSGIGVLFSYGIVQASGILYAQYLPAQSTAQYLLALKIVQTISQFSQAPFYSRLPSMARLYATGGDAEIIKMSARSTRISLWTFSLGCIAASLAVPILLRLIGSQTNFISSANWYIIAFAFFFERVGAMHIQLYSLTNKILWHIANGITGILMISGFVLLFNLLGSSTFPVVMCAAYLGFYCPYSMAQSYRRYKMEFPAYELATSVFPFVVLVIFGFAVVMHGGSLYSIP